MADTNAKREKSHQSYNTAPSERNFGWEPYPPSPAKLVFVSLLTAY